MVTAATNAGPSPTLTPETGPLAGERLVAALRRGGHVLYFRHAATQLTPDDQTPVDLADCATQRNLSEAGRAQSTAIGEAIRKLAIPIGTVLASPFCRTLDTARLAFGRATPEYGVENLETVKDDAERQARIAGARRLLSTPPAGGANTVIVAHGNILTAAASVTVPEGGAAIFRSEGNGRFTFVATVDPGEWAELMVPASP
jgi:broad specificity phosphatase PhoE